MMRRRLRGKENRVGSKRWGVAPRARTQAWIITVKTSTTFLLNGSSGNASYTSGGTVFTTTITTVAPHGLVSSQQVMLAGVDGTTNANGRRRITKTSPNQFSIASQWNGAWTSGGCIGDGGITIPSSVAHGRWRRIYSDGIVRWFGATGNGTTDDTTSIQGALCAAGLGYYVETTLRAWCSAAVSCKFPRALTITAPLNVPEGPENSNIVVEGAGQDNTILKGYGYFFPIIQSVWGNKEQHSTFLGVRDLTLASDFAGTSLPVWSPCTPVYKRHDYYQRALKPPIAVHEPWHKNERRVSPLWPALERRYLTQWFRSPEHPH